jgi:hypothetical protein
MKVEVLRATTVVVLITLTFNSFAQDKAAEAILPVNLAWSEGSILTNEGAELFGLLRYNDKSGLLSYENGNRSSTYTARGVVAFEFFDDRIQKQRVFYSFPYEDVHGIKRPLFFEVVMEFKEFAVLSKVDPIDISHKTVSTGGGFNPATNTITHGNNYGTSIEISQTETIYLMDSETNIKPYVRIVETDIDGVFYDRKKTKNKMLDNDLLAEFVGKEVNEKLVDFAKEQDLSFKDKNDLMRIFSYYHDQME